MNSTPIIQQTAEKCLKFSQVSLAENSFCYLTKKFIFRLLLIIVLIMMFILKIKGEQDIVRLPDIRCDCMKLQNPEEIGSRENG